MGTETDAAPTNADIFLESLEEVSRNIIGFKIEHRKLIIATGWHGLHLRSPRLRPRQSNRRIPETHPGGQDQTGNAHLQPRGIPYILLYMEYFELTKFSLLLYPPQTATPV